MIYSSFPLQYNCINYVDFRLLCVVLHLLRTKQMTQKKKTNAQKELHSFVQWWKCIWQISHLCHPRLPGIGGIKALAPRGN